MEKVISTKQDLIDVINELKRGEEQTFTLCSPDGKYYVFDFDRNTAYKTEEHTVQDNPFYVAPSSIIEMEEDSSEDTEEDVLDIAEDLELLEKQEKKEKKELSKQLKQQQKEEEAKKKLEQKQQKLQERKDKVEKKKEVFKVCKENVKAFLKQNWAPICLITTTTIIALGVVALVIISVL